MELFEEGISDFMLHGWISKFGKTYVQNFYVSNFILDSQFAYFVVPISNLEIKTKQFGIPIQKLEI